MFPSPAIIEQELEELGERNVGAMKPESVVAYNQKETVIRPM